MAIKLTIKYLIIQSILYPIIFRIIFIILIIIARAFLIKVYAAETDILMSMYQKPQILHPFIEITVAGDQYGKELLNDFYLFIQNKSNLTIKDSVLEMFKLINNTKNKDLLLHNSNMADQTFIIIKLALVQAYKINDISYMYLVSYFAAFQLFLEGGNEFDCITLVNSKALPKYLFDIINNIKLLEQQLYLRDVYIIQNKLTK